MALDPIIQGTEDLYEVSKIYLFGKPFKSLRFVRDELAGSAFDSHGAGERLDMPPDETEKTLLRDRFGPQSVTEEKAAADDTRPHDPLYEANKRKTPRLARIYSFSYEGQYFKLPYPLIYLVWGEGECPDANEGPGLPRFETQNTGLEGKGWRFASDIRVWKMDKHETSMAIDVEVGKLEDILIDPICSEEDDELLTSRGKMASRGKIASRGKMTSRGKMASRGKMVGSH